MDTYYPHKKVLLLSYPIVCISAVWECIQDFVWENGSRPTGCGYGRMWYSDLIVSILRYWPIVRGNHLSAVDSLHKGQWRGAVVFSLICAWRKRLRKQSRCMWFETPSRSLWYHSHILKISDHYTESYHIPHQRLYVDCKDHNKMSSYSQ